MRMPSFDRSAETAGTADGTRRKPTLCGDIDMRIGRDGTWFYHGTPIGRKPLVTLFSRVLRRGEDGGYWLVTPVEKARITVEDVPFLAVEMLVEGAGEGQRLVFRTNVDDEVTAGPRHPLRVAEGQGGEPAPYLLVREGLEARLVRSVFYELVDLAETRRADGRSVLAVASDGMWFELGELPDEADA